jgi:hypothetical protein
LATSWSTTIRPPLRAWAAPDGWVWVMPPPTIAGPSCGDRAA